MDRPELEWLARYRKGDTEALGKLVEHYRRPLFGFIYKMTERGDDAEEIFQEVWFRAIRGLGRYRHQSFLSWLFRIAHNLVIDRARKARPVADLPRAGDDAEEDPFEGRVADRGVGPDAQVAGHDLGRRMDAAVGGLPLEQREVFLMRMEGNLPFKTIAEIQKTSINTALARMQYALAKLREQLKEDYADLQRT